MLGIDWREACRLARGNGTFTSTEKIAAGQWATCAVGEQRRRHPDVVTSEYRVIFSPADDVLFRLGDNFADAVKTDDVEGAECLLDAIEDRVLRLKREQM